MPGFESIEQNVDRYEAWFEHHRPAYESGLAAIRVLLPKNEKGVGVGVGTGRFAAPLSVSTGIDLSPAIAKLAIARGIDVCIGVGVHRPHEDSRFDFVLLVTTICFLDDVPAALAEAYRVLRPRGCLLIGFLDCASSLGKVYESCKQDNVFYQDARLFTTDKVVADMKQAGFCDFVFLQTLFENPNNMQKPDPVKPSYGEGAFVVARGTKPSIHP